MAEPELRVLVADDERFFREAIRDALDEAGIACEVAGSGDEVLRVAADPRVGVVVLDVGLGGGGADLLRRLRAERPAVRVIVLSAHTDHELVLEALRLDASDYLAKPLHEEELVLAVRRAMASYGVESSWQRLRERLGRLESRLSGLFAAADEDPRRVDLDAFTAQAAEALAFVLDADKTSVMLLDPEANELRVVAATGSPVAANDMDPVALGEGVAGVALSLDTALLVDDIYQDSRFTSRSLRDHYETSSLAVAPLRTEGRALGVLCATDRIGGDPLAEDDLALMRILAVPVTGILVRAALQEEESEAEPEGEAAADPAPAAEDAYAPNEPVPDFAREVCEVLTLEIEPDRIFAQALERAAEAAGAPIAALHLIDNPTGELALEQEVDAEGGGDRERLPRTRGLTGTALQTGALVATPHPENDPRFDPDVDTASDGQERPLLCVPLRLRGKVLGVFRAFPENPESVSARTGELIGAALSAAVRNVLLYRSLLETIDELAEARREGG